MNNIIKDIFKEALLSKCLTRVLEFCRDNGCFNNIDKKLSRKNLVQLLTNPKYREAIVPGSQFDMVQQKVRYELEIESGLRKAKKKGMEWRAAYYSLNIGELDKGEYARLKRNYEK